jgi:branched-chain amino acid aminotransferase
MEIKLTKASTEQLKTPPATLSGVEFGTLFSDHMFCMEWDDGKGWHNAKPLKTVLASEDHMF